MHRANPCDEQQRDSRIAHLPGWSFISGHQPYGKPEDWADAPVLVVRKSLHLPVASWRRGLASVFRGADALHAVFGCVCHNPQGLAR